MARPRAFDEAEALQKALFVTWRHGYEGATYAMLEEATGVRARSLINVFGDKDEMFARILAEYRAMAAANLAQFFDPPSIEAVAKVFNFLCQKTETPEDLRNCGCLMVNTVFELGKASDRIRDEVETYRTMWRDQFAAALRASSIDDVDVRAEFLLGALWGALSQIRLSGRAESAAPLAAVVVETLSGWAKAG